MYSLMWSLWLMGVLAAGSLTVSAASFPKHMLVGKAGDSVTVECPGVSSNVKWMIGDVEMSETSPKWQIPELDEDWTGEYSCLHGSQQATVHVVLEDTPDSRVRPLECWAENYVNCSFMCDWSDPNYPLARARNERTNGHPWVLVSPDGLFHVSHNTSAHHEEDAPINVTVEALTANKDRLVKISKTFFLRDIIRPPAPQVTVCRNKTDAVLDVDIRPAGSWPLPSYFPLEYEIEYLKKDNGELKTQLCCKEEGQRTQTKDCWTNVRCRVPVRVAKFHVHARDPLVKSGWGPWTEWMNGGTRAKHGKGETSIKNCEEEDKPKGKGRKRKGDGKGKGKGKGRGKGKGKRKGKKNSHICNDTQP